MLKNVKNAFMLRMNFKEDMNLLEEYDDLIVGWSGAKGLLDEDLSKKELRGVVCQAHYSDDDNYRRAGQAAGCLWRFIREMEEGDLVVVPHENKNEFYIAEVAGPAEYREEFAEEGTAYRRKAKWLNNEEPIKRKYARAALQSKMKSRLTCISADEVIEEIKEVLSRVQNGEKPNFTNDLREKLIERTSKELYSGVLNNVKFEELLKNLLISLGGKNVKIIPKNKDLGADVVADFSIANTFSYKLAIQARHYDPNRSPITKEVIDYLSEGMDAENASIGWVVTSGKFSEEAIQYSQEIEGYQIDLIDGVQLATIIVEEGIKVFNE